MWGDRNFLSSLSAILVLPPGVFKSQFQFHFLWLICSYFLFLPVSVCLERLNFSKNLYFSSRLFLLSAYGFFVVVCYDALYFSGVSYNFSFFMSNFIDLSSLLFFLFINQVKVLSVVFIFSKNQLLILLIFPILFYFIYLWFDLYNFFPSTNFGAFFFCSSFSSCKDGLLFKLLLVSFFFFFACFLR